MILSSGRFVVYVGFFEKKEQFVWWLEKSLYICNRKYRRDEKLF